MNEINYTDFSKREYWDKQYSEKETIFEWLRSYAELKEYIVEHIARDARILIPGCGNSALGYDMFCDGYNNIVNMDYSSVVIEQMSKKFSDAHLQWDVMDITKMTYENESFDVILDKGTLDALTCGENDEQLINDACSEYSRVLKKDGIAYIISFGQPDARLEYFDPKKEHLWVFDGYDILPKEFAPHSYFHVYKLRKC